MYLIWLILIFMLHSLFIYLMFDVAFILLPYFITPSLYIIKTFLIKIV
jgi:hypothetical protein